MIYFLIWCVLFVISILIELTSPGLFFFLSFAIGSAAAAIVSLLTADLILQIISFITFSILSFVVLKRWVRTESQDSTYSSNVYALIGKQGTVIEEIALNKKGSVKINGEIWSAKSLHNEQILLGQLVEVVDIKGIHAIVKKINKS